MGNESIDFLAPVYRVVIKEQRRICRFSGNFSVWRSYVIDRLQGFHFIFHIVTGHRDVFFANNKVFLNACLKKKCLDRRGVRSICKKKRKNVNEF